MWEPGFPCEKKIEMKKYDVSVKVKGKSKNVVNSIRIRIGGKGCGSSKEGSSIENEGGS